VKKKQEPTKSKRSPHGDPSPEPSSDEAKSNEEWEVQIPEAPVAGEFESEGLPDIDEGTKVVLLAVNPYLVHVYWGIAAHDRELLERVFSRPGPRAQPVLRFYDVTRVDLDPTNVLGWFDVEIDLRAGNWYVHLENPAKSYFIDLGLRTEGGAFQCLARSNVAETPRAWPSDEVEENYLLVEDEYPRAGMIDLPGESAQVVETLLEVPSGDERDGGEAMGPERRGASRSAPTYGEAQGGEERGAEPKGLRFFHTAAPRESERKLADLLRRLRRRSGFAPKAAGRGEPRVPAKARADLTEVSERGFRTGVSSGSRQSS
jgi:hypothetical protein